MSEWIEDPFKSIIGGTIIIGLAVATLTLAISLINSLV